MKNDIHKFWAKTGKVDSKDYGEYHPLICHSIDVGNVTQAIWDKVFRDRYKENIADKLGLSVDETGRWIAYWASLHDIGKLSPAFQFNPKLPNKKSELEESGYSCKPMMGKLPYHSQITTKLLEDLFCIGLDGPAFRIAKLFCRVPGAHHGIIPTCTVLEGISPNHLGDSKWNDARDKPISELGRLFNPPDSNVVWGKLDTGTATFITGFISVADWIGSMQEYFPAIGEDINTNEYFKESKDKAKKALEGTGWLPIYSRVKKLESFGGLFDDKKPRELQRTLIESLNEEGLPDFLLLEWSTGEGKTEAAFWTAANWMITEGQKGLYVALPTQATSNQMWSRTGEFLGKLYDNPNLKTALVHGLSRLIINESTNKVDEVFSPTPDENNEIADWFSQKKRALLQPFGVGTIDQALMSVLQVRHFFVRLFGLAGKTVILDEVHAYDTYTTDLMVHLLKWLSVLNCRVVLLSATLPSTKRKELLEAYAHGTVELAKSKYPSTVMLYGNTAKVTHCNATSPHSLGIDWLEGPEPNLVNKLTEELSDGGCAVVIANTVGRAQKFYDELNENILDADVTLLHSRFPYEDRREIESKLLGMYGPPNNETTRPDKSILVATQVVEQSLDFDFDVMITDLAPIDLLLQRAGRLHRHDRSERGNFDRKLWIIEPETEDGIPKYKQNAIVYDEYIVLKTWYELKQRNNIAIPKDVQQIIEAVYGDEINAKDTLHKAITEAKQRFEKEKIRDSQIALNAKIAKPTNFRIFRIDQIELREEDPRVKTNLRATTRLSMQSVQVICLRAEIPGELSLFEELTNNANKSNKISPDDTNRLLRRSCSISTRPYVNQIIKEYDFGGSLLRQSPMLKYYILLLFENDANSDFDGFTITLDSEKGLSIEKQDEISQRR